MTAASPRVLVIDNYDSFVYNLVQYVGEVVTTDEWLPGVDGEGIFAGLPAAFEVGRYHSLAARRDSILTSVGKQLVANFLGQAVGADVMGDTR